LLRRRRRGKRRTNKRFPFVKEEEEDNGCDYLKLKQTHPTLKDGGSNILRAVCKFH
jgi:hypothetical protein